MPKPQDATIHAFAAQFREENGFVFYRRLSYLAPWLGGGRNYIVTREERDRFIADFNDKAPGVFQKMERDMWKAAGSFILSSLLLHQFAGVWFTLLEQVLFFIHLTVIFVVEHRRLAGLWNAPVESIAARAPVDFAFGSKPKVFMPLGKLRQRDLVGCVFMGALTLTFLPDYATRPWQELASRDYSLLGLVLGLIMLGAGVASSVELVRRIRA